MNVVFANVYKFKVLLFTHSLEHKGWDSEKGNGAHKVFEKDKPAA